MNANVQALLAVLQRPDVPEDTATPEVLFHRAKLSGFGDRQSAVLASYLSAEDVVLACALAEANCPHDLIGAIVF